jgi:hypothetical protein
VSRIAALILLLTCLFGQAGSSAAAVRLMSDTRSVSLAPHVLVLEDPTGTMTLADAQRRAGEFKPSAVRDDAAINFGYSSVGMVVARRSCRGSERAARLVARGRLSDAGQR